MGYHYSKVARTVQAQPMNFLTKFKTLDRKRRKAKKTDEKRRKVTITVRRKMTECDGNGGK